MRSTLLKPAAVARQLAQCAVALHRQQPGRPALDILDDVLGPHRGGAVAIDAAMDMCGPFAALVYEAFQAELPAAAFDAQGLAEQPGRAAIDVAAECLERWRERLLHQLEKRYGFHRCAMQPPFALSLH